MTKDKIDKLLSYHIRELKRQGVRLGLKGKWDSDGAILLLLATAWMESRIKHRRQLGCGVARSFYQVEPATAEDNNKNYTAFRSHYSKLEDELRFDPDIGTSLEYQPDYALFHARLWYWRRPFKMKWAKEFETIDEYAKWMAGVYKKHYNTNEGAADLIHSEAACKFIIQSVLGSDW